MKWFKKHVDYLNNPMIMTQSLEAIAFLDMCMAVTAHEDRNGEIGDIEQLVWATRQSREVVERLLFELEAAGLITSGSEGLFLITIWEESQSREQHAATRPAKREHARPQSVDARAMSYPEYLATDWWQEQRSLALHAAGYRCQVCNSDDPLDVHHRTYERLGAEAPGDVTVLCRRCHTTFHETGALAKPPR